jgi:KDO2-lipid IV(A) lauroyltransferase
MQLIAFILIYPLLWVVSILPFRILYAVSDLLYVFIYYFIGYRKKVVQDNLKLVFPEKSEDDLVEITKKFYRHLCDMFVESIKSMNISLDSMKARYKFNNLDIIKNFEKQNKNIVLMCAHYGSWEWIFILQTYTTHRSYAIYKRLQNTYFDRLVKSIRARYNSYLITTKETFTVLEAAKKNGVLFMGGFASDQSPKKHKARHWANFMGINVPVHTGAEALAKKLDVPIVFFAVERVKRGYYEATFQTLAETPKDFKDYEITDRFLELVENQIKQAPEYYLWTHKRWKHRKV